MISFEIDGPRPRPLATSPNFTIPCSTNRSRHALTVDGGTPTSAATAALATPFAASSNALHAVGQDEDDAVGAAVQGAPDDQPGESEPPICGRRGRDDLRGGPGVDERVAVSAWPRTASPRQYHCHDGDRPTARRRNEPLRSPPAPAVADHQA